MFRETVIEMDAIVVVDLMEESLKFGKSNINNIQSMAPHDEEAEEYYNILGIF